MKKTLKIFQQAYSLLEAAPPPEPAGEPPPEQGNDPTMPAEPPPAEGAPEVQDLTSQAEVAYIVKLIKTVQSVIAYPPDEQTSSDIANINLKKIKPDNARKMLSQFENMLIDTISNSEVAEIDNNYEL
jgi:hypothetical protein